MRLAQPPRHNGDERIRPDDGRLRRTSRRSRRCRLSRALSHSVRPAPRQAKRLGARKPFRASGSDEGSNPSPSALHAESEAGGRVAAPKPALWRRAEGVPGRPGTP